MSTIICKLILLIIFFQTSQLFSKLIINEVMPSPLDGEPEWIEMYNSSGSTIYVCEYSIHDLALTKQLPEFAIKPQQYAVLCKDTAFLKSIYKIPENSILVQCAIPSLNNTFDALVLQDSNLEIVDSIYYDMKWGAAGVSLERIDFNSNSHTDSDWSSSISPYGATPGEFNSISIISYDISCKSLSMDYSFSELKINILDEGKFRSENFKIQLAVDINKDNLFKESEIIFKNDSLNISERDTVISIKLDSIKHCVNSNSVYKISANVYALADQRRLNDTAFLELFINKSQPLIKINEIMYDVASGESEYIEIWNGSSDTLLMDNYLIWDAAGSKTKGNIKIFSNDFKIPPDNYGVIIWDSLFFNKFPDLIDKQNVYYYKCNFNLNISSDDIILADFNGKIYDSLKYEDKWHNKDLYETKSRSLEKINPSLESNNSQNWTSCSDLNGGTPGFKNSTYGELSDKGSIIIEPNPFAPSSTGSDSKVVCTYKIPYRQSLINVKIYDINGFEIAVLLNNKFTGPAGSFEWDGKNKEGYVVPIGQYICLIEASDFESNEIYQMKTLIVVGN